MTPSPLVLRGQVLVVSMFRLKLTASFLLVLTTLSGWDSKYRQILTPTSFCCFFWDRVVFGSCLIVHFSQIGTSPLSYLSQGDTVSVRPYRFSISLVILVSSFGGLWGQGLDHVL